MAYMFEMFVLPYLISIGMIVGAVFLFRSYVKTNKTVSLVLGILLCVFAGIAILGWSLLLILLTCSATPYA